MLRALVCTARLSGGFAARACRRERRLARHDPAFGSKRGLYRAVLGPWDDELETRLRKAIAGQHERVAVIDAVVEALFEFLLSKRDWVALTARATTGEELPEGIELRNQSWIRFIESTLQHQNLGVLELDPGLLLITVQGILNNHILARSHYQQLYGKDVTSPRLKRRTKQHLKSVILALVNAEA